MLVARGGSVGDRARRRDRTAGKRRAIRSDAGNGARVRGLAVERVPIGARKNAASAGSCGTDDRGEVSTRQLFRGPPRPP